MKKIFMFDGKVVLGSIQDKHTVIGVEIEGQRPTKADFSRMAVAWLEGGLVEYKIGKSSTLATVDLTAAEAAMDGYISSIMEIAKTEQENFIAKKLFQELLGE